MMQTDFATLKTLPAAVLGILLGARAALGTDWPQFRGPNRDGNWDEMGILESFPREGLKIRWRQPVGGGWSSPVVVQGRVFVFDVELIKPSAREGLHCFEEKTGKVLWVYAYEEKYGEWSYVPERGAGPTATPIVERDRIYVVGANLIRAQLSPAGYREISRSHLIDPTRPFGQTKFVYAPPAFANRHVFARNEAEVVCASLEAGQ